MTVEVDGDEGDDWPLVEGEPPPCPVCGRPSRPIVYGMPGPELMELAERGAVVLGGCVIGPDQPTHECVVGHTARHEPPRQ